MKYIYFVQGEGYNPYRNLALESLLFEQLKEEEIVLYLWQNDNTVVLGRNQNAYKECIISDLERNGGFLARRLSGGGAVYHDKGNLNFTFLASKKNFDVKKQMHVIIAALKKFDVHASLSGRNDIIVEEKKFSGNAFYERFDKAFHHGTLLINVDKKAMTRYLRVDYGKIKSKGVSSIKSRVINLQEIEKNINITSMTEALIEAFKQTYGLPIAGKSIEEFEEELFKESEKFSSKQWVFRNSIDFTWQKHDRFAWGDLIIELKIKDKKIKKANAFSDAMEADLIESIPASLKGCDLSRSCIEKRLNYIKMSETKIYEDLMDMLEQAKIF